MRPTHAHRLSDQQKLSDLLPSDALRKLRHGDDGEGLNDERFRRWPEVVADGDTQLTRSQHGDDGENSRELHDDGDVQQQPSKHCSGPLNLQQPRMHDGELHKGDERVPDPDEYQSDVHDDVRPEFDADPDDGFVHFPDVTQGCDVGVYG